MKPLSKDVIIKLYHRALIISLKSFSKKPKFRIGQFVVVRTKEPNLSSWTWMDEVRREKQGKSGIVDDIEYQREHPDYVSGFSYYVRFPTSKHNRITFVEEHLRRQRKKIK